MTPMQILFLIAAAITLVSAVMVVTVRRMMHAALWLVLSLLGVAMIFAMLEASFFAVVQVVVYIGAIATLIIFAVMLTRRVMDESVPQTNRGWGLAVLASAGIFAGILGALSAWVGFSAIPAALPDQAQNISMLGRALVSPDGYVLPFEIASVLLLAVLVGAIYVATEQTGGKA